MEHCPGAKGRGHTKEVCYALRFTCHSLETALKLEHVWRGAGALMPGAQAQPLFKAVATVSQHPDLIMCPLQVGVTKKPISALPGDPVPPLSLKEGPLATRGSLLIMVLALDLGTSSQSQAL